MSLAVLALQRVFLLPVCRVIVMRLVRVDHMLLNVLLVFLHHALVHFAQRLERQLDVVDQVVGTRDTKVLTNHNPHHLQSFAVRRHRVRRHHPAALTEMVRNRELVVELTAVPLESECNQRQSVAAALAHNDETKLLQLAGNVVCCAREIEHNRPVAVFAETNHLIVLTNHLRGSLGEVERKASLVGAQVVDIEHEFLGEVFG